ncbi:MAG: YjbQ family protein [Gammaproteobacteria bacterium]|nr:secondary thiamine-phosphate synthase enzyme YjbQ [Gammaproteobacteria bacterium]NNM00802.1 YjbQ family protein [Gammaproteobacteria bacterium]
MVFQGSFEVATAGRGTLDITREVTEVVVQSGVTTGLCNVFIAHTSASLILCENADPDVRADLEAFMLRAVPDGDPLFRHRSEGPDDMPAHVRAVLTASSLLLPVSGGRCVLGTWQGIYLWEHRLAPHRRRLTVTVMGE